MAREGSLHSTCKLPEPAPRARAKLAWFFPGCWAPSQSLCLHIWALPLPELRCSSAGSWGLGTGVCTQGKCQSCARAWDAASFARAQVRGAVTFPRARVPPLKPTHHSCSRIWPGSRSAAGHPLGRDSGEHPPPRSTAPLPCLCPCCNTGGYFCPFPSIYCVRAVCAVGEGCGVCFVIASFPPITFCLKTGFALILDPRPGSLGSMPWALALRGSWGTEIPGSDPGFDAKLSANTPPFSSPWHKLQP